MSEFVWIDRLRNALGGQLSAPMGIGDDGAILAASSRVVVADMMVEGVHFDLRWSSIQDVAWKLYASNASDILAMGAQPTEWMLTIALPSEGPAVDASAWIAGFEGARAEWGGGALIGGDTTRSRAGLVASVTMFGALQGMPWLRSAFRPGQRVWVDGPVGFAAAGLFALQKGDVDELCPFVAQHRRPKKLNAEYGSRTITGAFDVSDGLSADLMHAARASNVRIVLSNEIPGRQRLLEFAKGRGMTEEVAASLVDSWQLTGGDDYVRVVSSVECPGIGWTEIGFVEDGEASLIDARAQQRREIAASGYDHFKS